MSDCKVCSEYFIGKCPHELDGPDMVEAILSWRSDDFGHDCQALLVAESSALQVVGEMYLALKFYREDEVNKLREQLRVAKEFIKKCQNVNPFEMEQWPQIEAGDALYEIEKIQGGNK